MYNTFLYNSQDSGPNEEIKNGCMEWVRNKISPSNCSSTLFVFSSMLVAQLVLLVFHPPLVFMSKNREMNTFHRFRPKTYNNNIIPIKHYKTFNYIFLSIFAQLNNSITFSEVAGSSSMKSVFSGLQKILFNRKILMNSSTTRLSH